MRRRGSLRVPMCTGSSARTLPSDAQATAHASMAPAVRSAVMFRQVMWRAPPLLHDALDRVSANCNATCSVRRRTERVATAAFGVSTEDAILRHIIGLQPTPVRGAPMERSASCTGAAHHMT